VEGVQKFIDIGREEGAEIFQVPDAQHQPPPSTTTIHQQNQEQQQWQHHHHQ
jgi:hypothetical protein